MRGVKLELSSVEVVWVWVVVVVGLAEELVW
jgi:hypothetical protein